MLNFSFVDIFDSSVMPTGSTNNEKILNAVLAGLSEVGRLIASMPAKDGEKGLKAAERSYYKTALGLGYTEGQAEGWAAMVMLSLRAEVEKQKVAGD